jgi:cytochrome b561
MKSDTMLFVDRGGPAVGRYPLLARFFHWLTVVLVLSLVASAVVAKQLNEDPVADTLLGLHKLTGALTLTVVLLRLAYRVSLRGPRSARGRRHPILHWLLYGTVILVPLVGWVGISDAGKREIFAGYSLPAIWPEHAGYDNALLLVHAYLAFALLTLVALHIGAALQDYMMQKGDQKAD